SHDRTVCTVAEGWSDQFQLDLKGDKMRGLMLVLMLVTVVMGGCGSMDRYDLGNKYPPLKSIVEADVSLVGDSTIVTIGKHCYVRDLNEWLFLHPPDSVEFHAIMLHEQVHATRQLAS